MPPVSSSLGSDSLIDAAADGTDVRRSTWGVGPLSATPRTGGHLRPVADLRAPVSWRARAVRMLPGQRDAAGTGSGRNAWGAGNLSWGGACAGRHRGGRIIDEISWRASALLVTCVCIAALAATVFPMLAIAAASLAFGAAIRLYEAVSGILVPRRLTAGVVAYALAALLLGEYLDGYEAVPALDLILHALSGAVLAAVGMALALLPTAGAPPRTPLWLLSTLAFGFAMMVGAMWEVMEFTLDATLGTRTQGTGIDDTMWDMVANLAGCLLGVLACHAATRSGRRLPGGGLLLDFVGGNPVLYGGWTGPLAQREGGGRLAGEDRALQRGRQASGHVVAGKQ